MEVSLECFGSQHDSRASHGQKKKKKVTYNFGALSISENLHYGTARLTVHTKNCLDCRPFLSHLFPSSEARLRRWAQNVLKHELTRSRLHSFRIHSLFERSRQISPPMTRNKIQRLQIQFSESYSRCQNFRRIRLPTFFFNVRETQAISATYTCSAKA